MAVTRVSNSVIEDGSVHNVKIADNAVDALKLNVTGNGTSGEALLSNGNGTFSWGPAGESYTAGNGISVASGVITNTAPDQAVTITSSGSANVTGSYPNFNVDATDTNTTYTAGTGLSLTGTEFSNTITNNNQLTNGAGYITSYTETDTLDSVTGRGAITSNTVQFGEVRSTGDVIAYYSSDKRLKDNIKPIENALAKIESIGGYTYEWNDKQQTYTGSDIGVIAQEIEAIAPELVIDRETGYKAVKYEKLVAILIEGIKELSAKVNELENKL
jgi:hypothetical protein